MNEEYLSHHGIKGQKWGVRRFQNEDMSLTSAGKERYGSDHKKTRKERRAEKRFNKIAADVEKLGSVHQQMMNITSINNHDGTLSFKESISKDDLKRYRKLSKEFTRTTNKMAAKYSNVQSSLERVNGEVIVRTQLYDKKLGGIIVKDNYID